MLRSCHGYALGRTWIAAGITLASLVTPPGARAQEAAVQASADLVFTDAASGRTITQRGITSKPGEPIPVPSGEVFTSGFSLTVDPSSVSRQWVMFHCQVGYGAWEDLPARINGLTVKTVGTPGHNHPATPPKGTWTPTSGHTADDLRFYSVYSAPPIAANETFTVDYTFDAPGHLCNGYRFLVTFTSSARKNLVPLIITNHMKVEERVYGHGGALYVTRPFGERVKAFATEYFMETRRKLRIHMASLPQGGLFDSFGDYAAPFPGHRHGTDIDVTGGVTENMVQKLVAAGQRAGLTCAPRGEVVHCSMP